MTTWGLFLYCVTMRYLRFARLFVITAVISTLLFVAFSWQFYRGLLPVKPLAELLPTDPHLTTPRPRLRNDYPDCTATEFQRTSKLFISHYVSTYNSQTLGGRNTSSSKGIRWNKNEVRVVVSPRTSNWSRHSLELPPAYVITPTYARATQKADLLRLCYTLMHVPRVHWIVVEDSKEKTAMVSELLANCPGPSVTHLTAKDDNHKQFHRGVAQRNAALDWIRRCVLPSPSPSPSHSSPSPSPSHHAGGVIFADDDNTYDLLVFEVVRWTKKVSIWPVGVITNMLWEGPICSNGKVTGWEGLYAQERKFPMDMGSFSLGVDFLLTKPEVRFQSHWPMGRLETRFLESLSVTLEQLTPEPDENCSQVLVWHTKTLPKGILKPPRVKPQVQVRMTREHKGKK